jgi:glutathione S-transferase
LRSYSEGAKLGVPIDLAMMTAGPIVALSARFNEANDENVRRDIAALPDLLNRVDAWIEAGVLNGEQLNAADFQIAPSLGLAMTMDDLRPSIENRPAGALAKRVVPDYPGKTPPILPPAWLQPLRSETAAA